MAGFSTIMDIVADNVSMSFEWIVLLIFILATLVFFAKDFKLGVITLFVTSGAVFVWFYEQAYNWTLPLVIFFMAFVMLALSLYAVNNTSTTGGFT